MLDDASLRQHLLALLRGGNAHLRFDEVVDGFPLDRIGVRPQGLPHSAWEILEHLRIAQEDIVRFSSSADYESPEWPAGYWPAAAAPRNAEDWRRSVEAFRKDTAEFERMIEDPGRDLFAPFPWGDGQTLLREALLIADHNAYHLGQLLLVRRLVGGWTG